MLRAKGISKRFASNLAVQQISLDVTCGEVVCIIGHNGSGKSTFLKMLTGWLIPDSGSLWVDGDLISEPTPYELQRRKIHLIPQTPAVFPHLTVLENLFAGHEIVWSRFFPVARWGRMVEEAQAIVKRLDLEDAFRLSQRAATLSGGEKTLLGFARTLRWNPAVLALDEPTASLGPAESELVINSLRRIVHEGVGLILVSHRLHEALGLADRFLVMRNGQLVAQVLSADADETQLAELVMR